MTFSTLVLSGGAFRGALFLGALKYVEEKQPLKSINTLIGSSSGSIVSFLLALDYSVTETHELCKKAAEAYLAQPIDIDNILNMFQVMGIDDGELLESWLSECLHSKKQVKDMTFIDFAKSTGKDLIICASNLTKKDVSYFSVDDSPHVSVIKAIRASIAVPFVFTPVLLDNELYVDAGIFNNFPMERRYKSVLKDTLGLTITGKQYTPNNLHMFSFIRLLIESLLIKVNVKPSEILNSPSNVVIELFEDDPFEISLETFKLHIDDGKMDAYFKKGYEIAHASSEKFS